jgi:hypothetical protein
MHFLKNKATTSSLFRSLADSYPRLRILTCQNVLMSVIDAIESMPVTNTGRVSKLGRQQKQVLFSGGAEKDHALYGRASSQQDGACSKNEANEVIAVKKLHRSHAG